MSKQSVYRIVAVLGVLGFGVLMALRTEPSSVAARVGVAALAGICLGGALLCFIKARSS
jgi:hypothetical protein